MRQKTIHQIKGAVREAVKWGVLDAYDEISELEDLKEKEREREKAIGKTYEEIWDAIGNELLEGGGVTL